MCGILGYTGERRAVEVLLEGLAPLEYRGYDSSGICVIDEGRLDRYRAVGSLDQLRTVLDVAEPSGATTGIGHTRWATHGGVTVENAHPFTGCDGDQVAIVLNGVIDNYLELRRELEGLGHRFESETDAEVVAHLIEGAGVGLTEAVRAAAGRLDGQFAFVVSHRDHPETLLGMRRGCPLLVGCGDGEGFLGSSVTSFAHHTRQVVLLEDDELAVLTGEHLEVTDAWGRAVLRAAVEIDWDGDAADCGGYETFMAKEIHEQPDAVRRTSERLLAPSQGHGLDAETLAGCREVLLVGCGTSLHAAEVAAHLLEQWAVVPCRVEVASEWRYRDPVVPADLLVVGLSQSGETADTIAALRLAADLGVPTIAVTNSPGSQITREVDGVILTHAGIEMGVAASKTFAAQVAALAVFGLRLAEARCTLVPGRAEELATALRDLPGALSEALACNAQVRDLARGLTDAPHFMYLGRQLGLPTCREGALKLAEITYRPATALPAGEMKHGPIALIHQGAPVVGVVTDGVVDKVLGNLSEVRARGARVIAVTPAPLADKVAEHAEHVVTVPAVHPLLQPVVSAVPLQLLAYHLARALGLDVDRPRNLAKTVTVE